MQRRKTRSSIPNKFLDAWTGKLMHHPVAVNSQGDVVVIDKTSVPEGVRFTPMPAVKAEIDVFRRSKKNETKAAPPIDRKPYHVLRYQLIGNDYIGKSSLMLRYTENKFHPFMRPTMGANFRVHPIKMRDIFKIQVWDLDKIWFKFNTPEISDQFEKVSAFLLIVDPTNKKSFESIKGWLQKLPVDRPVILVGTKADLIKDHVITEEELKIAAQRFNLGTPFMVSSKTGENIKELFEYVTNCVLERLNLSDEQLQTLNGTLQYRSLLLDYLDAQMRGMELDERPQGEDSKYKKLEMLRNTIQLNPNYTLNDLKAKVAEIRTIVSKHQDQGAVGIIKFNWSGLRSRRPISLKILDEHFDEQGNLKSAKSNPSPSRNGMCGKNA